MPNIPIQDVDLHQTSLGPLFELLAKVPMNWRGRPVSQNIEDRRYDTADDEKARVIMELMRTEEQDQRRRQEINDLVDAVMHGYPGQPMPYLNRVTNKFEGQPGAAEKLNLPDLGFDVRDYHLNER